MRICLLLGCVIYLYGCVEPALVVGQPGPALASGEVDIYYAERPRCDFETVAHFRASGGYLTLAAMFRHMRIDAAKLGAGGLYVVETSRLDSGEFIGTAKAIRCLPA